jgi:hypothetical protein
MKCNPALAGQMELFTKPSRLEEKKHGIEGDFGGDT